MSGRTVGRLKHVDFEYFQGPEGDMSHFEGVRACSFCRQAVPCFSLEYAWSAELPESERQGAFGCSACLRAGRFEFWHDTEIGMLSETGLEHVYKHSKEPPPDFSPRALVDLRHTPQIATWQQELWLTHCRDFMVYEGTWEPADFNSNAPDGDGHKLFLQMTDEYPELWAEATLAGESHPGTWHATYYVFRCRHCGLRRGNWDCD